MDNNPKINYGFELEFASSYGKHMIRDLLTEAKIDIKISLNNLDPDYTKYWYLGTDNSVLDDAVNLQDYMGYELRSRIFSDFPFDEVKSICEVLKKIARITPTSGLHFHYSYSSDNFISPSLVEEYVKRLRMPKKERRRYCMQYYDKYRPICRVLNEALITHYECRVFNASLKPRAIFQNWKTLNTILNKCMNLHKVEMLPEMLMDMGVLTEARGRILQAMHVNCTKTWNSLVC